MKAIDHSEEVANGFSLCSLADGYLQMMSVLFRREKIGSFLIGRKLSLRARWYESVYHE